MARLGDIYFERDEWKPSLVMSVTLHAIFFGGLILYSVVMGFWRGQSWGGSGEGGGAMSATLVSTVPLPAQQAAPENVLANESKGLSQSLPKQEEKPEPKAIPIAEREAKKRAIERSTVQQKPRPVEPSNVIPYGQGGPVSGPYGVFSAPNAKGGFGFTGSGGDFGSRYAWYVDKVRRMISENWMKYEVDPSVSSARRVYITFDIQRTGQPANIQVEQSSGVPSLDISALRALQRIDSFGPLPPDYSGSRVSVEFWFDYRR